MKRILLIAAAVLALLIGALAWLGNSESGLRRIVAWAETVLPGDSTMGEVSGALYGPLTLRGIVIDLPAARVDIETLFIDWRPQRLFGAHLALQKVSADGVTVALAASTGEQPPPPERISLPEINLPLEVSIASLEIRRVRVVPAAVADEEEPPILVDELTLTAYSENGGVIVDDLVVSGPGMDAAGDLAYRPRAQQPLLTNLSWHYAPDGIAPLSGTLKASGDGGRSEARLTVEPPWGARLQATLEGYPRTPTWSGLLALDGFAPATIRAGAPVDLLSGTIALHGDFGNASATLDVSARVPGYPDVLLRGTLNARPGRVDLADLEIGLADLAARIASSGTLEFGAGELPVVELKGTWQSLAWPLAGGPDALHSRQGQFQVSGGAERYNVTLKGALGRQGASGDLDLSGHLLPSADPLGFSAQGRWSGFSLPLGEGKDLRSQRGEFRINGDLDAWQLSVDAQAALAPWTDGPLKLSGSGNSEGMRLSTLEVSALAGTVRGSANLRWAEPQRVAFDLKAAAINPGLAAADWGGNLNFSVRGEARRTPAGFDAQATLADLGGALREQALSGGGSFHWRDEALRVDELDVRLGDARVQVAGRIAEQSDLSWEIDVPELARLLPDFSGTLRSDGAVTGSRAALQVEGDLEAKNLKGAGAAIGSVAAHLRADLSGVQPSSLSADARELSRGDLALTSLAVDAVGVADAHEASIVAAASYGQLEARFAGGLDQQRDWRGQLEDLTIDLRDKGGTWQLEQAVTLLLGARQVEASSLCLQREPRKVCAQGEWSAAGGLRAEADVSALPLADLAFVLPPALLYSGDLNGSFRLLQDETGVNGEGRAQLEAGSIRQLADDEENVLLDWSRAETTVRLANGALALQGAMELQSNGAASFELRVPMDGLQPDRSAALSGHVGAEIQALPILSVLIPDVSRLRGSARLDVDLKGTLDQPVIVGRGRLSDASAEIPRLGIVLREVSAGFDGDADGIHLEASATSAEGKMTFNGDFKSAQGGWSGSARLQGENFLSIALPEARAELSPDVTVKVDGRTVNLEGEVRVPRARLEPRDLSSAIQVSADEVLISQDAPVESSERWRVFTRVRLVLGDEVQFKGYGLTGRIAGDLIAVDVPDRLTTGSGELQVLDGEYRIYGRELAVERGRAVFTGGSIANPGLDVRASRAIGEVSVGVDIRGTLRAPELTLHSTPALSQSDALSYLVLGRPVSGVKTSEQGVLNDAASSLGLSGAAFLASQVGRRIGLDEVSIESTEQTDAALVVGKYLSPKLYVSYGLGLFDSVSTLLLRYELSPRVSVQTEAGEVSSADIFYTIER